MLIESNPKYKKSLFKQTSQSKIEMKKIIIYKRRKKKVQFLNTIGNVHVYSGFRSE